MLSALVDSSRLCGTRTGHSER